MAHLITYSSNGIEILNFIGYGGGDGGDVEVVQCPFNHKTLYSLLIQDLVYQ